MIQGIAGFAESLRSLGLYVKTSDSSALMGLLQAPDSSLQDYVEVSRFSRQVKIERYDLEDETVFLEDACFVEMAEKEWSFRNTLAIHIGSLNLDIIQYCRPTLQDIFVAAKGYYLQPPIVVGQWILPVYQHPRWNLDQVITTVQIAKCMTYFEAERYISDRFWNKYGQPITTLRNVPRIALDDVLYYKAQRLRKNGPHLYLRYDCQEAITASETTEDGTTVFGAALEAKFPHFHNGS